MAFFSFRMLAFCGIASIPLVGCAPVSSEEGSGVFSGANAQLAAGNINRASTAATAGLLATGAPQAATTNAVIAVIAKHQASVRQRQVAEKRAREIYARLVAQRTTATETSTRDQSGRGSESAATKKKQANTRDALPPGSAANARRPRAEKRIPRYLAVETVKDERTAPAARKAVMIWDTETQEIVGNNVYDIASTPPVGATSRFEIFSAEYVGAGL